MAAPPPRLLISLFHLACRPSVLVQVGGLLELFRAIDAGAYGYGVEDFKDITGKEPTSIAEYVEAIKGAFQ